MLLLEVIQSLISGCLPLQLLYLHLVMVQFVTLRVTVLKN